MLRTYAIYCENTHTEKNYPFGTTLAEIAADQKVDLGFPILGAMVNNSLKELTYMVYKPKTVFFIGFPHNDGQRMYLRSLSMVLFKAARDLYPDHKLKVQHSVSGGLYCELTNHKNPDSLSETVDRLRQRMTEIIAQDLPFERDEIRTDEALKIFERFNLEDKCTLMRTRRQFYSSVYRLDDVVNYFYGYLVPSTAYLNHFGLEEYYKGMLLVMPEKHNPNQLVKVVDQPKLFEIFKEYKDWLEIIGVPHIGQLNQLVLTDKSGGIIKVSEALQEKKVAQIADMVQHRKEVKVVFVSGPSSSGKTTFAKRLSVQLWVLGYKPIVISMDNYFVDREHTPLDANGDYDFESPNAIDVELLNANLNDLFAGKEIDLPKFSFVDGKRFFDGTKLKLEANAILVIEGIHALNPLISKSILAKRMMKVYVSALTSIRIDSNNNIPTNENRLIRRIVRDSRYRGYSALDTMRRWPSVRLGEEKHIFPYQEEADVMFNTALVYELGVLRRYAEPLLKEVPPIAREYSEAQRLLKFLSYVIPIDEKEIPPTSILREFLDGSSFDYS
ncbi:MAG: nucleoside kinase [Bacteroidales bacterium]|jgi:uridine kinase|nr:nucleoside kinase [Bacteroidales bacterium]